MFKFNFLLVCMILSSYAKSQNLKVIDNRCEYKINPIGLDIEKPRLSWKIKSQNKDQNVMQIAYQIQVSLDPKDLSKSVNLIWDSGKVTSDRSNQIEYDGIKINSGERAYWRAKTWDNKGRESAWSQNAFWEMGLLDSTEWQAKWISPGFEEKEKKHNPSPMLRKEFKLGKNIAKARLYITSHGLYTAYLNGDRVGDQLFTPGWTSFHKRLQYQTYDVTSQLQNGENTIAVILGDGWFRGKFGFANNWNIYGTKTALLCQMEVEYKNGTRELIISDNEWRASTGAIRLSSIYDGEVYDARIDMNDWKESGFDDSEWYSISIENHSFSNLIAPAGVPVRKIKEISAVNLITTPKSEKVIDFGQNLVGWVRFKVRGNRGDTLSLYHAEVLDKDGNFYTDNLRSATQKIKYILNGEGEEVFEPHFTFQGFRYVKVINYPGEIDPANFSAIVIHSDMEPVGSFECSHPLINQLQSNIEWGQRGNFVDVPTDCPQRDERMGWTGDAQAFAPTACFNFNSAAFYTKWLGDVKADQRSDGAVPFVIPNVLGENAAGSTGWADAATIIPWTLYLKYRDKRVLANQYESMKNWVEFLKNLAGDDFIVNDGFHFGDWLFFIHPTDWNAKPGYTDIDLLATAFFAHSTQLLINTATVLEKNVDVQNYTLLLEKIKEAFKNEFLSPNGRLSSHTQTAYTLSLAFDLLPKESINNALGYLVANIENRNYHLSTGFLGTPHLCHVLSKYGRTDIAYKLLVQESYPSWLYPITKGATTIWERWDGIKPDDSFQDIRMNSFNHYAYGAIGDWMYKVVAGINEDVKKPGYKHIIFRPEVDTTLSYAKAEFESLYGAILSSWKIKNDSLNIKVSIPPNTTATIHFPKHPEGIKILDLGSGTYEYSYPFKSGSRASFGMESTLGQLWENKKARSILIEVFPELGNATSEELEMGFPYTLPFIAPYRPEIFTESRMKKFEEMIKDIND